MAMYNMLNFEFLSRDRLRDEGSVFLVPFSNHDSSEESAYEFDAPDEHIQDSVTKKRRHAVYYHRPPVWCPTRQPGTSSLSESSSSCCTEETCSDHAADDSQTPEDAYSCIVDGCDAIAAIADVVSGTETNQSQSDQETIILHDWPSRDRPQTWQHLGSARKNTLSDRRASSISHCPSRILLQSSVGHKGKGVPTRLQAYKDIRLGLNEKRSIHEGSLVICVDPAYTLSDHDKPHSDEFDLISGNIFVVCRLYSDLWALCASASPTQPEKGFGETIETEPMRLAFLPLCAVTLAANFSAFNQRCINYAHDKSDEPRYPGNGLPVMPPPRTSSLSDGKHISRGNRRHIAFPEVVYDAFNRVSFECSDADFVPADSSLENVLSDLTDRGSRRLQRLGNRMSIRKLWSESKRPAVRNSENQLSPSLGCLREPTEFGAMQRHSDLQRRSSWRSQRLKSLIRVAR